MIITIIQLKKGVKTNCALFFRHTRDKSFQVLLGYYCKIYT